MSLYLLSGVAAAAMAVILTPLIVMSAGLLIARGRDTEALVLYVLTLVWSLVAFATASLN